MNKEKILVVEDDMDINNLIKITLEKCGYKVIQDFSGSEAVLRIDMDIFNIILLGLMLPGVSGEQLIEKIRDKVDIPIIVISAKSALEDKVNLLNIEADDYITKPFQCEELVARVNSHLRKNRRVKFQINEKKCINLKI